MDTALRKDLKSSIDRTLNKLKEYAKRDYEILLTELEEDDSLHVILNREGIIDNKSLSTMNLESVKEFKHDVKTGKYYGITKEQLLVITDRIITKNNICVNDFGKKVDLEGFVQ